MILSKGLFVQSTVLKVPHHASLSGLDPAFLAQVKPEVAVYMAGVNNSYGFPRPETLSALAAVGATVYGTDQNGTVTISTDGHSYNVSTQKGSPRLPSGIVLPTNTPILNGQLTLTPGSLTLKIMNVTSPIARGQKATLVAQTLPEANCTIQVNYKSGPSHASGLDPQVANSSGTVSWSWYVSPNTTPGNWSIVVTATLNGQKVTVTTPFEVTP